MANTVRSKVLSWHMHGMWVVIVLGFIFHFAFDLLNRPGFLAVFFPVNESVWEHLKLGLWPVILMGLFEFLTIRSVANNIIHAVLLRFFLINGTVLIVFYTYTFFLGHSIVLVDILVYMVGVIVGQRSALRLFSSRSLPWSWLSLLLMSLIVLLFGWFSYEPLHQPIFMDSRTGQFGM